MKKKLIWILGGLVILIITVIVLIGIQMKPMFTHSAYQIDDDCMVLLGYGGNSLVLRSRDGTEILVVDTKMAGGARRIREAVDSLSTLAEIFLVNTHAHGDHAGGNKRFPEAIVYAGAYEKDFWQSKIRCPYPDIPILPGTETVLQIGDETVRIRNMGRAHSWNDVVVYLETRKLLVTGDLIFNGWHPALLPNDGTQTEKWIQALDSLEAYDVQIVVPGHGPVSDLSAVTEQRNYFISIRCAVDDEVRLDSLESVFAAYWSLPYGTGFDKTVSIMKKEMGIIK